MPTTERAKAMEQAKRPVTVLTRPVRSPAAPGAGRDSHRRLGRSGYLGGELAYRYGVRAADETTQVGGYRTAATTKEVRP